jgi:hypothetical protein
MSEGHWSLHRWSAALITASATLVTVGVLAGGVVFRWPLGAPVVALGRLTWWLVVTGYVAAPVLAAGEVIRRRLGEPLQAAPLVFRFASAAVLGWGLIVVLETALLACGMFFGELLVLAAGVGNTALVIWLAGRRLDPARQALTAARHATERWRTLDPVFRGVLLICAASALLLASLPPDARDELVYHLALPRQLLLQNDWWVSPDNAHWLFPANTELLWAWALAVGGVHVPRLVTLGWAVLAVTLAWGWMTEAGCSNRVRQYSLAFLILAPMSLVLAGICNVEWPLVTAVLLGWWASRRHLATGEPHAAVLVVVAWGLAVGVKYSALPVVGLLIAEWLVEVTRRRGLGTAIRAGAIALLATAVFAGGWWARNWKLVGDPLYPLHTPLLTAHEGRQAEPGLLMSYSQPPGPWRLFPWLYHATADDVIDHRLHLGWPLLLVAVVLVGARRAGELPWVAAVGSAVLLSAFGPAPRVYAPVMVLTWLFLPGLLQWLGERRPVRIATNLLLASIALTSIPWFWVVLTRYSTHSQHYLLGVVGDRPFLRLGGAVTPTTDWVARSSPPDARVWVWCSEQTFYLNRWARASSFLDRPRFLDVFERGGGDAVSREIAADRIDLLLVNTGNCPLPIATVRTERHQWPITSEVQQRIAMWMAANLDEVVRDDGAVLFRVRRR